MASFAKLLPRPRLQLLVLMLVLVAGPLPKNSMAQDDPAASPDAGGSDEAPAADKASGRAEGGPPPPVMKDVECWECGPLDDHCKKPSKPAAKVVNCKGYCYQDVMDDGSARRYCATASQITCYKDKPDQCEKYKPGEKSAAATCLEEEDKKNNKGQSSTAAPVAPKGRSGDGPKGGMRCICDKNLCNDKSSGPTGVKQIGYSAALVGALMVAIFPLRTLFLVG